MTRLVHVDLQGPSHYFRKSRGASKFFEYFMEGKAASHRANFSTRGAGTLRHIKEPLQSVS